MVLDGKLVGQSPWYKFNSGNPLPICAKCSTLIDKPICLTINLKHGPDFIDHSHFVYSYIETKYFIYETKAGHSVVYCGNICRDQHNHRFHK